MKRRLTTWLMAVVMVAEMALTSSAMAVPVLADEQDAISEEVIIEEADDEIVEEESTDFAEIVEDALEEDIVEDAANLVAGPFHYEEVVEGYNVVLDAAEGVVPEGAKVSITSTEKAAVDVNVELLEDEVVTSALALNIVFTDAEGNTIAVSEDAINVSINAIDVSEDAEVRIVKSDVVAEDMGDDSDEVVGISYEILIITHFKDDKAPVLKDMKLKNNVYAIGESDDEKRPTVIAHATDDISGISNFYAEFRKGDEYIYISLYDTYTVWENNQSVKKSYGKNEFQGKAYINEQSAGKYKLCYISISDRAGNYLYYNESNMPKKYKDLSITVKKPSSDFKPVISALDFDKKTYDSPAEITTTATITSDDEDYSVDYMDVYLKNTSSKDNYTASIYVGKDYSVGYFGDSFKSTIKSSLRPGKYVVYKVKVKGYTYVNGQYMNVNAIYSEDDKNLPAAVKGKGFTIKGDLKATPPTVKSVKFSEKKIELKDKDTPGKFSIVVDTKKGKYPVQSVTVQLYDKKQGRSYNYYGSHSEYDGNLGQSKFVLNAEVSPYIKSGNYVLNYVLVYDTAGNGRYYSADGKIIKGWDKQYYKKYTWTKFTSDMKKLKLNVKYDSSKPSAIKYTVKFNSNGGKGSMKAISMTYGKAKKLTANKFSRAGYKFNGWNTKKDGTGVAYKNKASIKNLTKCDGEKITLYAQWVKK